MMHYWLCAGCGHRWDLDAHDTPMFCPACGSTDINYTDDEDERLIEQNLRSGEQETAQ